jgi:hypothetical protein
MLNIFKNANRDYENYRWFFTSSGVLVVGGKSDEQNEVAMKHFFKPEYTILHTSAPGSPFMILQSGSPSKKDVEEAAIFCACFSQQWKKSLNKKIDVDVFKGNQLYKNKSMKTGTFGVKGEKQVLKVKPELIAVIQKGRLRAVPDNSKDIKLMEIKQGKLSKEEAAEKISKKIRDKYHFPVSKEEILKAIPSDRLSVK